MPKQVVIVDQSQQKSDIEQNQQLINRYRPLTNIIYLYQKQPSSTEARNRALSFATEPIIIFSDDDVDVYEDTLYNISTLMADRQFAMIAGTDDNTAPSQSNIGYLLGTKSYRKRAIGHVTLSMLGRYPDTIHGIVETQWAMGYFFAVRKCLLEQWNICWDESMSSYAYAEDLDFSFSYYKRAAKEGLKCILSNEIHVKHRVSSEYRVSSRKSTYMYIINRRYLSYKHKMGWKSRVAMDWCDFWRLIERIIKRQAPKDLLDAYLYYRKNKEKIIAGKLFDDWTW